MPLPVYANPPVVETVLGIQFDTLPALRNGHLGAFWLELSQREWPSIGDAPPLPNQFENFADASVWARAVQLQFTQDPAFRIQIRNADLNRMIQVQNSRLHFNWMKGEGGRYPHYDAVRREFSTILDQFRQFVAARELGEFKPNQWEVTYVNQIPRGTVWNTPADWGFFRPLGGVPTIDRLIEGESFGGEWHFIIPGQRGRLHVDWQHGKARGKGAEAAGEDSVRLNLTARGPIQGADAGDGVMAGLDLGHETVVRAFACLMSDTANRYWEITNAGNG